MTGVRCPRCHRDAPELTAFCVGCGAPLLLKDEGPAGPVDAPLDLDRRSRAALARGRGVPPVELPGPSASPPPPLQAPRPRPPALPRAEELADVEKSHWDLGAIAAAAAARGEPERGQVGKVGGERTRNVAVAQWGEKPSTSTSTNTNTNTNTSTVTATGASAAAAATGLPGDLLDDVPEPEVDAVEVHVERAETWRRVVSWAVDGVPFLAAGGAAAFFLLREAAAARGGPPEAVEDVIDLLSAERVITLSITAAVALALATYATLAHALAGATLGKRLAGIRVIGPDGGPPSPARSAIRSILAVVSAALLGLGFLLALFTRTGRALHDVLARTWVVKAP